MNDYILFVVFEVAVIMTGFEQLSPLGFIYFFGHSKNILLYTKFKNKWYRIGKLPSL
jgi:hypothetical protein